MIRNAIVRNYHLLAIADLLIFTDNVLTHMTGNPNFATPTITLAAITTARDALAAAAAAAIDGDRDKIRIMHERQAELIALLDGEADYVEDIALGNADILLSSGFSVNKIVYDKHAKPEVLLASAEGAGAGGIKVSSSNKTSATAILSILTFTQNIENSRVERASDHQINIYINDVLVHTILTTTKGHGDFVNLPRHKLIEGFMVGFNAAGLGPLSLKFSDIAVP